MTTYNMLREEQKVICKEESFSSEEDSLPNKSRKFERRVVMVCGDHNYHCRLKA